MSRFWRQMHPAGRATLGVTVAVVLVALVGQHLLRTTPVVRHPSAAAVATLSPTAAPSPAATPAPTTVVPASTPVVSPTPVVVTPIAAPDPAGAETAARGFAKAYLSYEPNQDLRAKLRPFDSDRLDAEFDQGGGSGIYPPPPTAATVDSVDNLGLAPDGRLVEVATVTQQPQGGVSAQRVLDLRLVRTPRGWRVDEVAGS